MNKSHTIIRIKTNDAIIFIVLLLVSFIAYFTQSAVISLVIAMAELLIIIYKAKFSFFSVLSFLLNFCLIQEFLAYLEYPVYGLLSLGYVDVAYFQLCLCIYIFNLIVILFFISTSVLEDEKKIYTSKMEIGDITTVCLLVFAVIITYLIFPSMPGTYNSDNRFASGFLPFTGWSCIPHFLLAVCILGKRKKMLVYFSTLIVALWYLMHGERIDAIGTMTFLMLYYFNSIKRNISQKFKIIIYGSIVLIGLTVIGIIRDSEGFNFVTVISRLIVQSTSCDVTHVFNCAVDLYKSGQAYNGYTYMSYLVNCIPFMSDKYSFASVISYNYYTVGGGMFFAEPFANFGILFVGIESFMYLLFVRVLIKKNNIYRSLIYTELCLSVFRTAWYGLNYPIITIIYFVPFVIIFDKLLNKKSISEIKKFKHV